MSQYMESGHTVSELLTKAQDLIINFCLIDQAQSSSRELMMCGLISICITMFIMQCGLLMRIIGEYNWHVGENISIIAE